MRRRSGILAWLAMATWLGTAACGGSAPKDAEYAPTPASGGYGGGVTATSVQAAPPPADAPMAQRESIAMESDEVSGSAASGYQASAMPTPAPPPPPPPAPAKPPVSQTDKKIANVDIERSEGGSSSTPASSGGSGPQTTKVSTAASADVAPHKSDFLIYTAQITMAVYQVEPGLAAVEQIAKDVGGYLSVRNDTSITIRVPRTAFDEAIRRIGLTGDVVHKDITAEDVTDQYVDMEARLKNAKAMRDRLQDLLQRASVKDAIEIQAQLGKVTEEIERLEGQLKLMRDKIAYSSIAVSFAARGQGALRDMPLRLPFPFLQELGLPRLMSLHE